MSMELTRLRLRLGYWKRCRSEAELAQTQADRQIQRVTRLIATAEAAENAEQAAQRTVEQYHEATDPERFDFANQ